MFNIMGIFVTCLLFSLPKKNYMIICKKSTKLVHVCTVTTGFVFLEISLFLFCE